MDTVGKNESNKIVIIIRVLIITLITYFAINMVICNVIFAHMWTLLFYGIFLLLYIGIFTMSYYYETKPVLWCFNICTLIWSVAIIHFFGWNVGVQHFIMLLLVLYFFSNYKHYAGKIIFAIVLCIFRLVLFYLYHTRTPVWPLDGVVENTLQTLNTVTIFWSISVISFVCSNDSQQLEGKLVEYNNQLEKQANTDTLTGLCNRRKVMEYMTKIVKHPEENGSFSVCICDIDFFKKVNDNYGHDFGDEVLRSIAGIFLEEMQGKNLAARWGGEEFLLLFPGLNGDEAYVRLEQIRDKIKEMRVCKGELCIGITMTFGLAEYDFYQGLDATIKEADEKLYIGKNSGRDVIIF